MTSVSKKKAGATRERRRQRHTNECKKSRIAYHLFKIDFFRCSLACKYISNAIVTQKKNKLLYASSF